MKTVAITGLRAQDLPGKYNNHNRENLILKQKIKDKCIKHINNGAKRFITSGSLGVDTLAFIGLLELKQEFDDIILELAIPFAEESLKWPPQNIILYNTHIEKANTVIYTDLLNDYKVEGLEPNKYSPIKFSKKNEYMTDEADILLVVWNEDKKNESYNAIINADVRGLEIDMIKLEKISL